MKMNKMYVLAVGFVLLFAGCADKEIEEFNKPAEYWYEKMVNAVSSGNLEKADNYYSSLQSEHIGSPFISEATMIMAQAHMANEEYLLSEHFLNEYIRRYATAQGREYAEFLKVKAKFLALPNPGRDQGLIDETIKGINGFKANYPESSYLPLIQTMEAQLHLAKGSLNERIAKLYDRLGKPKAAEYYRNQSLIGWVKSDDIQESDIAWYREIFEGDGNDSWYSFLIPETKNVISMDDNQSK